VLNLEKSKVTVIPSTSYKNIEKQNVAAYARVSTAKDTQLQSLDAQISYYKDKIKSNPAWNFAGVFVDAPDIIGLKQNPTKRVSL
jgi:site-specific DNA recombinase